MSDQDPHLTVSVRFDYPIVVWVLQLGGWLPLQFTPAQVVLVDKNVLRAIERLASDRDRPDLSAERWWLTQLNSERFRLNALLCAHEGDRQAIPTYREFCCTLAESTEILARSLPKARLVEHSSSDLARAYENVTATAERHEMEARFLIEAAALLVHRTSATRAARVERQILQAALDCGLDLQTFAVLAALSCLYEPQDGSEPMIGRGVIKPHKDFSARDAHNALSDLRSLEILSLASGVEGPPIGYCTRDKDLAALWTYLRVSEPRWAGNRFSAAISPAQELFPRLNAQAVSDLISRLRS